MDGSVQRAGSDEKAAAAMTGAQNTDMKGQIYDKMKDGDVSSSRRQEVCQRAVASARLRE